MSGDWVVTIKCRNPAMATGLAHHLRDKVVDAEDHHVVAVASSVYVVYKEDIILLRKVCKAAATGFAEESEAKAAFLGELKMLPARTKGERR